MLEWYVYLENVNERKIIRYNVFNHWGFSQDLKDIIKELRNKEELSEEVRRLASYYFWAKCEYEVLITSWIGRKNFKDEKVDVYDQLQLNWNAFIDYIWKNKKIF